MRGGHGDAAKRQVADVASSRGVGNGVPDKFADYARFDDMFGASRIFTDGTARQRKKETEMYVKDVMERRVYGYTHDLRMHGEPLLRVPVGAPLDEQASSRGKQNPLDERKRRDHELGPSLDCKATGRKKARMSPGAGGVAQGGGVKPAPRAEAGGGVGGGRAASSRRRARRPGSESGAEGRRTSTASPRRSSSARTGRRTRSGRRWRRLSRTGAWARSRSSLCRGAPCAPRRWRRTRPISTASSCSARDSKRSRYVPRTHPLFPRVARSRAFNPPDSQPLSNPAAHERLRLRPVFAFRVGS